MLCKLCKREVEILTKHHITPKCRGGSRGETGMVCLTCKDMIHQLISNKDLDRKYDSIEKLLKNHRIKKYVKWIKNKKTERMPIATKKRR